MIGSRQSSKQIWLPLILVTLIAGVIGVLAATPFRGVGIGLVLGGLALLVSLSNPTGLLTYVYPLLIPVGQIPIPVADTTVSLERLLLIVTGLSVLAAVATRRLSIAPIPKWVAIGFTLWFALYALSLAIFPSERGWIQVFGYGQKAIMAYLVLLVLRTPEQIKTVLKLFLISSFILSFFTIAAYVQEGNLTFIRAGSFVAGDVSDETYFRGLARVGAGNVMAVWIALLFLWQAKNKNEKYWYLLLVLWLGMMTLFALRREVLVTIPLGMALMFWHFPIGHRKRILRISLAIVGLFAIFILWSPEWLNRLSVETVNQIETGTDPRTTLLLRFTPAAFIDSPLIGHGPSNYAATQLSFPGAVTARMVELGGISAHNAWSAALVEAGIIAFLGLCLFLYGLGRPLWQKRRVEEQDLDLIWAFAPLIFFQVLSNMFFGHAVILPVTWFWFGFLLALERITRQANTLETGIHAPAIGN